MGTFRRAETGGSAAHFGLQGRGTAYTAVEGGVTWEMSAKSPSILPSNLRWAMIVECV